MEASLRITACLFTDIERSSQLWEQQPTRMSQALALHDGLLRAAVEANHGVVVKMVGDGMHAAFDDPLDAVNAALAIELAIADPAATYGVALRVRCAVHVGAVERRDNDFFGATVNRAARLMSVAHGGQVLLSQATVDLIQDRLPAAMSMRDLGAVRLRDLAVPEHACQLLHPQLRQDFPALSSLESIPNNLPRQLTSFVGRERELTEVKQLLAGTRLLTLLGVGGIGKTRLALQVAATMLDSFPGGVWFADLAPLVDPASIPSVIADILGVQEEAGKSLTQTLFAHLHSQRLLLILDNCEHLLDACAHLVDSLLHSVAAVRVLATSREPLQIAGEQTYPLPALSLPGPTTDIETLARSDAVRLFVERARLQQPDFALPKQAQAVARLCTRLDGIPLALELAAARIATLAVERMVERLDDRFRLLTGGSRTALPRQQTLRTLIDWSYDLLDGAMATLFARLSVFAGGWTIDAAEVVGAAAPIAKEDVLDLLASLVQKSLIVADNDSERYRMLETIRLYARDRLQESREEAAVRGRHRDYFLALVEKAEPALRARTDVAQWLHRLDLEHDNVKAALHWSVGEGNTEFALRFCGALGYFWNVRGHWREGREWCAAALARYERNAPSEAHAKALLTAGVMSFQLGESVEAESLVQQVIALSRKSGNRMLEAGALNNLSNMVRDRGDFGGAQLLLEQALAINRGLGNVAWETINLGNLGLLFIGQGNAAAAQPLLERALALSRELGNRSLEGEALGNLGLLAQHQGDYAAADALAGQALTIFRELVAPSEEIDQLQLLAESAAARGSLTTARRYFREILEASGVGLPGRACEMPDRHRGAGSANASVCAGRDVLWRRGCYKRCNPCPRDACGHTAGQRIHPAVSPDVGRRGL